MGDDAQFQSGAKVGAADVGAHVGQGSVLDLVDDRVEDRLADDRVARQPAIFADDENIGAKNARCHADAPLGLVAPEVNPAITALRALR